MHFTEYADEGGVLKARCNFCPSGPGKKPWDTVVNATRMAKHLKERHRLEVKPEDTETEPEVEPRSPPQPLISSSPSPFFVPSSSFSSFVNSSPGPAYSSVAEPSQPALKKPKNCLPSGSLVSLHQCVQPFSRFQEKSSCKRSDRNRFAPFLIYFLVFLIYVLTSKTQFYTFELPLLLPPSPSCRHDPPLTLRTMRWKNDGSSELLAGRRERSLASCVLLCSRFPPFPLSRSEICMLRTISIWGCGNQKGKFHENSLNFMKFHEISLNFKNMKFLSLQVKFYKRCTWTLTHSATTLLFGCGRLSGRSGICM